METLKKSVPFFKSIVANHTKSQKNKKYRNSTTRVPAFVQSSKQLLAFLFVKSCLECSLLVLITGLAEKSEHVLLISFNAGLVERIYSEEVT